MQSIVRPHLGVSAQQRIATRKAQIVETAYALIRQGVWLNTSIRQLCEHAGLNKRYFYESFKHIDEVAIVVFEQITTELQEIAQSSMLLAINQHLSQSELAIYVLEQIINFLLEDQIRFQILFTDHLTGIALLETRHQMKSRLISTIVEQAKTFYQAQHLQDPLIQITATMLLGGTIEILTSWQANELQMTKPQLILNLAQLWQSLGDTTQEIIAQSK